MHFFKLQIIDENREFCNQILINKVHTWQRSGEARLSSSPGTRPPGQLRLESDLRSQTILFSNATRFP